MRIGDIGYLYILGLEEGLLVRQEFTKDRFVKIIEEEKVNGGPEGCQYMKFKAQSLYSDKTYIINNYLSNYKFSPLEDLDNFIEKYKGILHPDKITAMETILNEVKETNKEGA